MIDVVTHEISVDEWKSKLATSDDEWLLRQFNGLSILLDMMDKEIDRRYHSLRIKKGTLLDDEYREQIYPMENDYMDMDIQFVDVEDELERRGINVLL